MPSKLLLAAHQCEIYYYVQFTPAICIATLIPCTDFCLCWLVYRPSFVVGVGMSSLSMLPMLNNQSLEFLGTG